MKIKKGKKCLLEYDLMILDEEGNLAVALDFKSKRLSAREKAIVAKHLAASAKEIKQFRV